VSALDSASEEENGRGEKTETVHQGITGQRNSLEILSYISKIFFFLI
jgi:hypothetical protein